MLRLAFGGFILSLSVMLAMSACSGDPDDSSSPAAQTQSRGPVAPTRTATQSDDPQPNVIVIGEARWPALNAESLEALVSAYDTILIGRVTGVRVEYEPVPTGPVASPEFPDGNPKASSSPPAFESTPESIYIVAVERVIRSARPEDSETASVYQRGALVDGVAYQVSDDSLLDVGTTYLFFVEDLLPQLGLDMYSGAPFGRYVVGDGSIMVSDSAWSDAPAVRELDGLSLSDAIAEIEAAIAAAPPDSD
jgi:hypothetical protein